MLKYNMEEEINALEKDLENGSSSIPLIYAIDEIKLPYFLLNQSIKFTPFIGRVDKRGNKSNIFKKITNLNFRKKIEDDIKIYINENNKCLFNKFKKKYRCLIQNERTIVEIANKIKEDDPNMLKDIFTFLKKNGITLFKYEEINNNELKYLDGFSCYYKDNPVIVIYEKKDKRRMLFTIMHELYHLLFDENEKLADKFAGSILLTINDIKNNFSELKIDKDYIEKNYENSLKIICKNNYISVEAATLALMNYKFLLKEYENYKEYFRDIREYIEKNTNENLKINFVNN